MPVNIPKVTAVCANEKCRDHNNEPVLEINFSTKELVYVCPKCGEMSKLSLINEATPLPRSRIGRR